MQINVVGERECYATCDTEIIGNGEKSEPGSSNYVVQVMGCQKVSSSRSSLV